MSGDEMGPVSIAAYWNGYDWSEVMSHGAYYSYGYAIVLYPLFHFFHTPESFFKSVIVVNALFSASITLLSFLIAKEMNPKQKPLTRLLLSLVCGASIVNISRSPSAWDEVFIALLCWILLFLLVKNIQNGKMVYYVLGAVFSVFLYITHQRNLGIVFVFQSFVLFISLFDTRRLIKYLINIVIVFLLLVAHIFVKAGVKENIWLNSPQSERNDFKLLFLKYFGDKYPIVIIVCIAILTIFLISVVIYAAKIKKTDTEGKQINSFRRVLVAIYVSAMVFGFLFLNGKRFDLTLYTVPAQFLYLGISSFGLFYLGILVLTVKVIRWVKNGADGIDDSWGSIYAFVLFAFWAIFMVSIMNTRGNADPLVASRADYMFYGRYSEPFSGLVWFFALLDHEDIYKKRYRYSIGTLLITAFTFLSLARYEMFFTEIEFLMHNCVACQIFFKDGFVNFPAAETVVVIFLILFIWVKKDWVRNVVMILTVVLSFIFASSYLKDCVIPTENNKYLVIKPLLEEKEKIDSDTPLIYFSEKSSVLYNASFVQYLMPEHKSLFYRYYNETPDYPFFGITDNYDFILEHPEFNLIDRINEISLFTNVDLEGFDYGSPIPLERFVFCEEKNEENLNEDTEEENLPKIYMSKGFEGVFMYGPYIPLSKGKYKVTIFYDAFSTNMNGEKGFFDASNQLGFNILDSLPIEDVSDGEASLEFTLEERTDGIEFRAHTVENQNVIINGIMIKKIID